MENVNQLLTERFQRLQKRMADLLARESGSRIDDVIAEIRATHMYDEHPEYLGDLRLLAAVGKAFEAYDPADVA